MRCAAAQCTVEAAAAVQWRDTRSILRNRSGSRAEPICRGHRVALGRLVAERRDPFTIVTWLSLDGYAAYLARAATTVRLSSDDLFR